MIRRCLLLAIAVATLSILMAAPAQAGFLKAIWGPIKVPPGSGGCPPSPNTHRCDAMHFYDELGADVFEYQLQWNDIAPTRPANPRNPNDPAYQWSSEFQHAINEANAHGMQVSFLIKGSPPWANGGKSWNWVPSAAAYADFARRRGEVPERPTSGRSGGSPPGTTTSCHRGAPAPGSTRRCSTPPTTR